MAQFISAWGSNYSRELCEAINSLNEQQRKVCRLNGGLAAIAGCPGAGKTLTVVTLLARAVYDGLDPTRILAMTFTRAAAHEMNTRLQAMGVSTARVGTIHSVCRQILISETRLLQELQLDDKGQLGLELKKCLTDMRRKKAIPGRGVDKDAVASFISTCKARGCVHVNGDIFRLNVKLFDALVAEAELWVDECGMDALQLVEVYQDMEKRRAGRGLYDFDDMLLWAWLTLLMDAGARWRWRQKYATVVVDECQDSNPIQWDLARLLVGLESCILRMEGTKRRGAGGYIQIDQSIWMQADDWARALYVFGDSSQSLYGFRSAVPELFVEFAAREDVTNIPLFNNYRSIPSICALGTTLVKGKKWHLTGEMVASNGRYTLTGMRENTPRVEVLEDAGEEVSTAIRWARELTECAAGGLNECAILSRTASALHMLEIECIRARIPYRKMCSGSFFDSKEVKDILAYLRVACGMDAQGYSLQRTINAPFRYISRAFIDQCNARANVEGTSLMDIMLNEAQQLSYPPRQALREWSKLLVEINKMAVLAEGIHAAKMQRGEDFPQAMDDVDRSNVGPAAIIAAVIDRTDYVEHLRKQEGLGQEEGRLAILGELQRAAAQFISPVEFINYVDELRHAVKAGRKQLGRKEDDSRPALTLSTIHRSKGLQWTNVRIVDVNAGRFPHKRAKDADEELRLLYVGITRTKEECVITANRMNEPSSFIGMLQHKLKLLQHE